MDCPYLAVKAYAFLEEHIVGALDFRCPTQDARKYPNSSVDIHCTPPSDPRRLISSLANSQEIVAKGTKDAKQDAHVNKY